MKKPPLQTFALLPALLLMVASPMPARAESFSVAPPQTIFTPEQQQSFGIDYPDGAIGVLKDGGTDSIFGAGGSFNGIGPGGNPEGTYKFTGSLEFFSPAQYTSPQHPTPSLRNGRAQPSPDGRDFDRDYAGGGPTYKLQVDGQSELLQIYHGEYHPDYPQGQPFYGGSGMAVSDNGGNSFTKIGEILAPSMTLQQFLASLGDSTKGGLPVDGFMIEADVNGEPISPEASDDLKYCYDIFTDRNPGDARDGFAIARVKKTELIEAVSLHKAPLFKKYYAPSGGFSEPGLGGSSTLIVTQGNDSIAWPQAIYCSHLGQYLLIYQTNQEQIQVRKSSNLKDWSDPITLVNGGANPKTFYPTAVGMGLYPRDLGKQFYLYYQRRNSTQPVNPTYYRSQVTINP